MCKLETKPFEHICRGSYHYLVEFYGAYPDSNIELKCWIRIINPNKLNFHIFVELSSITKKGEIEGPYLVLVIE
jgi:hypothetical protein